MMLRAWLTTAILGAALMAPAAFAADKVIPQGATLKIRVEQGITANKPGQTYPAEVATDIRDSSGKVLAPMGSPAELKVVDESNGGTVGTPSLALAVDSITVNGTRYRVSSSTEKREGTAGIGANRRTAEMVGGGAVLGTILGAVAGGGKGAAIGGTLGAVGGGAAQVLTRGKEVHVPAETVLAFKLTEPWKLTG